LVDLERIFYNQGTARNKLGTGKALGIFRSGHKKLMQIFQKYGNLVLTISNLLPAMFLIQFYKRVSDDYYFAKFFIDGFSLRNLGRI
jgi:hypothetical protein